MTKLLDALLWPFYAMGYICGIVVRMIHRAEVAVQLGIEEGRGEHGIMEQGTATD